MTRRIAITILLTVWSAILVAGVSAYLITGKLLLAQLDESIKYTIPPSQIPGADKIASHDEWSLAPGPGGTMIRAPLNRRIAELLEEEKGIFIGDGGIRSVTFHVKGQPAGKFVVGQASADEYNQSMLRLAIVLAACGTSAGIIAALVAVKLARVSLRPLSHTAEVIGTIDESKLDRRVDSAALPAELRPMAAQLNEMLERLGRAFEQRRRFLADASHELRTPVAAMITTMEVALRRPRPAAELAETLQTCLSEARHMRQLVQALLRQVRAAGPVNDEESQNVDAGEMLKECADLAGSLAAEKNVHLVRTVSGNFPVRAEPSRLRSVMLNLMSNAIEYNHPGGTVELSARCDDGSTEIVVKDDGPGISPEHLPHLFQPFYRATRNRESDGHLGLGLFLVDSHVKAMGGECRVESSLGSGTTFRVRLPTLQPGPTKGDN